MATTPIIKLTKGNRSLDLMSGRYKVADNFVPPEAIVTPLIASGTSANRLRGGVKVGSRAQDRQLTFGVEIKTTQSEAEVNRALRDLDIFLSMAGDRSEPLYLEYRPNSDVVMEPLWGNYGMNFKYEIIHASSIHLTDQYSILSVGQTQLPASQITLTIKPYALGLKQRLASALGCIRQDRWGTTDGALRGTQLIPAITNKMTNPVFGAATYNTGWTADASLTVSKNVLAEFLLPETIASAKLVSRSTNQRFYQSINAGNTNTHHFNVIVKAPDGGTVSASVCELFYSVVISTTYTNLGNGYWMLTGTASGINAATNTGIEVKNGRTLYLIAYSFFQGANNQNGLGFVPVWGDNLGVAWTGTAHASTSTSTAGRVRTTVAVDTFEIAQGSIRMIVKWNIPNTINVDMYLFSCGSTSLRALFNQAGDTVSFTDNTNTATSAALTFSVGTIDVFDFVYSPAGGLAIYRNGVSIATNATYTPPAVPTYIYWGTNDSGASHLFATMLEVATYDEAITVAESLANYNNVLPLLNDDQNVGTLPYLWTKDGDDVVDNCDDSTRDNFCVCEGIPGSDAADTDYLINPSNTSVDYYLGLSLQSNFVAPTNTDNGSGQNYFEESGTADANSSGGAYVIWSGAGSGSSNPSVSYPKWLMGGQCNFIMRARALVDTAVINANFGYGTGTAITGNTKTIPVSAAFAVFLPPPITIGFPPEHFGTGNGYVSLGYDWNIANAAATLRVDLLLVINGPLLKITGSKDTNLIVFDDAVAFAGNSNNYGTRLQTVGEKPEVSPAYSNIIFFVQGTEGASGAWTITNTATFRIDITPRWSLV